MFRILQQEYRYVNTNRYFYLHRLITKHCQNGEIIGIVWAQSFYQTRFRRWVNYIHHMPTWQNTFLKQKLIFKIKTQKQLVEINKMKRGNIHSWDKQSSFLKWKINDTFLLRFTANVSPGRTRTRGNVKPRLKRQDNVIIAVESFFLLIKNS